MHKVTGDRAHAMVCMTASGFFTMEETERAAADLHAAIRSLGPRAGYHVTLYDYSDVQVVPGPVLERFSRYFTDPAMKPLQAKRVAFVTRSALLRLQLQLSQRDHMRVFADRKEATAWLLAAQERPRTTSQPTAASG